MPNRHMQADPCVVGPMWPEYMSCRVVCTVDEFEDWLGM